MQLIGGGRERRPILGDAAATTVMLLVTSASLALIAVATARWLGPSQRGIVVIGVTLSGLANHITSAGINVPARVLLARGDRSARLGGYLSLAALLVGVQGMVAALVLPFLLAVAKVPASVHLYLTVIAYAVAISAALFAREGLYGIGRNKCAAGFEAVGSMVQVVLVVVILLVAESPVAWQALAGMALGNIAQVVLQSISLMRSARGLRLSIDRGMFRFLLGQGVYGLCINVGQAAALRADRYILAMFAGTATVGIYSVAATGADYLWLGPLALSQVLFHGVASGGLSWSGAMKLHWLVLPMVVVGGVGAYALAPALVPFIFGSVYEPAVDLFRVFIIGAPAVASFHVTSTALAGHGLLRQAAVAGGSGGLITTSLCVLLIPWFGVEGAAWGSVVSFWAMAIISLALFRRHRLRPQEER